MSRPPGERPAAGPFTASLRRGAALAGAIVLGAALTTIGTPPARAATVGYVRLAHLSPDTPPVDVYLSASTGSAKPQVFPAVGYGMLSAYLPLPSGRYAVSMRPAGAPATDRPVLTTEVAVAAGMAYTVAGVGRYADLGLRVLHDDLSAPMAGRAKVRVIQGSVRALVLDVAAADGPTIASGVPFATTTPYAQIEPGRWNLRLRSTGAPPAVVDVTLTAGTVYSLLVLDAKPGGLTTELRGDAKGGAVVAPSGGVDTGAGGLAEPAEPAEPAGPPYPLIVAVAGALLAVIAGPGVRGWRRRGGRAR